MGGLLGDGSINSKNHYSYNESHTMKHQDYNLYIEQIFSDVQTSKRTQLSGKGSMMQHFKVFSDNQLKTLREEWYGSSTVHLPESLSWLDDEIVAKWYMDNGSLSHSDKQNDRACLSTNSFNKSDVERLAYKLKELYGVSVSLQNSKGWSLRINYDKGTISNFWNAISKYVLPSMRYKLPEEYRNVEFIPFAKAKHVRNFIPVLVESVNVLENTKKNFPHGRKGFDIETSTNNYFCGGVLVHNSSCTVYFRDGEFGVCSRNIDLKEAEDNSFWKVANQYNLRESMTSLGLNIAIQGELVGSGVQGNIYNIHGLDLYIYDVFDIDKHEYFSQQDRLDLVSALDLNHVPILTSNAHKTRSVSELLEFAEGKSLLNRNAEREGIVLKSFDGKHSCKAVSNKYLLKQKD
jgi:hypothetical protein